MTNYNCLFTYYLFVIWDGGETTPNDPLNHNTLQLFEVKKTLRQFYLLFSDISSLCYLFLYLYTAPSNV